MQEGGVCPVHANHPDLIIARNNTCRIKHAHAFIESTEAAQESEEEAQ